MVGSSVLTPAWVRVRTLKAMIDSPLPEARGARYVRRRRAEGGRQDGGIAPLLSLRETASPGARFYSPPSALRPPPSAYWFAKRPDAVPTFAADRLVFFAAELFRAGG